MFNRKTEELRQLVKTQAAALEALQEQAQGMARQIERLGEKVEDTPNSWEVEEAFELADQANQLADGNKDALREVREYLEAALERGATAEKMAQIVVEALRYI